MSGRHKNRIRKKKEITTCQSHMKLNHRKTQKKKGQKSKALKNMKKTLNRNRDFRCVNNDVGKKKRLGLSSVQDEEGTECHNK